MLKYDLEKLVKEQQKIIDNLVKGLEDIRIDIQCYVMPDRSLRVNSNVKNLLDALGPIEELLKYSGG